MIKIKPRNLDKVSNMISRLPREIRAGATKEAGIYLQGNERRGLKHYPTQVSWMKYRRTMQYRFGWKQSDSGVSSRITNNVPYAVYPRTRWSGFPWKWRTIPEVIKANTAGMLRAVKVFVDRWIRTNEVK